MPIDNSMAESGAATVNYNDVKAVGENGAILQNLATSNAVASQQMGFQLNHLIIGGLAKKMLEIDITEAVSLSKAATGNEIGSAITSILGSLGAGSVANKIQGTSPPVTQFGIPMTPITQTPEG